MSLPDDFSKIFGSTATGGLTPISDVNYAKGWEFVGSAPPTKNDFSYLQNLSDLKSQWLYSNKLQRVDPFGDIKADGMVTTALTNLGFVYSTNLYKLPGRQMILRGTSITNSAGAATITFPLAFTGNVSVLLTGSDSNGVTLTTLNGMATNTGFSVTTKIVNGNYAPLNFSWLAWGEY